MAYGQTTSSTSRRRSSTVSVAPTGAAAMTRRARSPQAHRACCDHRGAGGEAVVDQDDRLAGNGALRAIAVQPAVECLGLPVCSRDRDHELAMRQAVAGSHVRGAAGRQGAEGVLRLQRVPDLADCDRVEREAQCTCDRGGNHDSPSRKAEHNCVLLDLRPELAGEDSARVCSVVEGKERQLTAAAWHGSIVAATLIVAIRAASDRTHGKPTARPPQRQRSGSEKNAERRPGRASALKQASREMQVGRALDAASAEPDRTR